MGRFRTFGICATLCVVALGSGMLFADLFRPVGAEPSGVVVSLAQAHDQSVLPGSTSVPAATAGPTARPTPSTPPARTPTSTPLPTSPTPAAAPTPPPTATEVATAQPVSETAAPGYVEYTVQKGDFLYAIAKKHQVTITDILAINQIADPASLTIGQVIRVPKK